MNPRIKKAAIALLFGINIFLTVFGFIVLYSSPYTGLTLSVRDHEAYVAGVDTNSPAFGLVKKGDRLAGVNGNVPSYLAFYSDPDYIKLRVAQGRFWEARKKLDQPPAGQRVELLLERGEEKFTASLQPGKFPFEEAVARLLPLNLVGWTFIIVAYLVLNRKDHEISAVNFIIGAFACMSFLTLAPYSVRDLYFPYAPFRLLSFLNYIPSQAFSYALLHMLLVFPDRKKILIGHPRLASLPYALLCFVLVLNYSAVFENTHLTSYVSMNACMVLFFGSMIHGFFVEKNVVYKRQIQWVVFGIAAGSLFWLFMTSLPVMFGAPFFISQELSVLFTVIYPLSFAFAVTRYRLMDIETIFDASLVYGVTLTLLAGLEFTFLRFASPFVVGAGDVKPYLSIFTVLLIVFVYAPLRNRIKEFVERLFRRGNYDIEKEVQKLTVSLSMCEDVSIYEKFCSFGERLLAASGVFILKTEGVEKTKLIHADNERALKVANSMLFAGPEPLWSYFRAELSAVYGYELVEKGVLSIGDGRADLENSLFVPFFADTAADTTGHLAVLLAKWNQTAYSKKDIALLNAISINIANIIEAGELRRERTEIKERFSRERDHMVRELHDGLGNILTSIAVASEATKRVFVSDQERAMDMVDRIGEYSVDAMDFLRTGLTVLDNPEGELGEIMKKVQARFSELFWSLGLELHFTVEKEVSELRTGAAATLNLIRCFQEALNNVVKHARAHNVRITLYRRDEYVVASIRDDGKGFSEGSAQKGFGLSNIRNRMHKLNGRMELESAPGKGTTLTLFTPAGSEGTNATGDPGR